MGLVLKGFFPSGYIHIVDKSAERISPFGIHPLHGKVREADKSQRDWFLRDTSTKWTSPQSGYILIGLVLKEFLRKRIFSDQNKFLEYIISTKKQKINWSADYIEMSKVEFKETRAFVYSVILNI